MMEHLRFISGWGKPQRTAGMLVIILFALTTGCSGSLMGDVTPPPNYQPTRQILATNPAAIDISPLLPPDPMAGKIVYDENCAPCHGANGKGDGDRVGSLPSLPPSLGSLNYSRKISPTIWFQTITQGKIDRLMPGYGSSLSDRQRWDVVAYLLTLETRPDQLADGKLVFSRYCQSCHGPNAGGGKNQVPALTESGQLQKSLDDLVQIISLGKGSMPAFGNDLTDDQKLNSVLYLRSLEFAPSLANPGSEDVQTTSIPTPVEVQPKPGSSDQILNGRVTNGSGGTLPPELQVELNGYDAMQPVFNQVQVVDVDGGFTFQHLPEKTGRIYLLTVKYKGNVFLSTAIHSEQPDELQNQRITIYEPSTDASQVKADRMHIFFEFPKTDVIRVSQLYILSNPTNSLITGSMPGNAVIVYPLPTGAANLQFQSGTLGDRFILTPDGFGDTQGILPGSGTQVLFSYELPYKSDVVIPIKIPLPVDTTNIMLPSKGVSVKSSQLQDLGDKTIQNASWHIYTSGRLAAGSRLDLLVSGRPKVANPQEDELNTNLAVGVIVLVTVLLIVTLMVYQKIAYRKALKQPAAVPVLDQTTQDAVLDAIIALDDQYHAGQIPPAAYYERRAELKNRLRGVKP